jgi:uncharacterized SAM-dependent methyltransferase
MITLVNSRIAKELGVNRTTIGNYIQDAVEGKNNLQTYRINNAVKLIDSPHNRLELRRLVEEGKKFRPTSSQKSLVVGQDFYNLFDDESQFEIIRDLEIEKQIDLKYYYYKQGASVWNTAVNNKVSQITIEIEGLLKKSLSLILSHFKDCKFNLIDIGCGNGQPADIIIETSQDILENCQKFIHFKFPSQQVETSHFDFQKVSMETHFKSWTNKNSNLFILVGNTICNYTKHDRYYLLNSITRAMDKNDLFLISYTLDTDSNKSSLSYVRNMLNYWLPSLLGIDTEKVETEVRYDHETKCKELNLRLDKAYVMDFIVQNEQKLVRLEQGEKINLWKHYVFSLNEIIDELKDAGLQLSFMVSTNNNVLIGCRLALK